MKFINLPTFILLFSLHTAIAQTPATQTPKDTTAQVKPVLKGSANSLYRQFAALKDRSNSYQGYKVIKESNMDIFWKNVLDSMSINKQQLQITRQQIAKQQTELTQLKQIVADREQKLQKNAYNTARISVIGIDMLKENYIYLNVGIISVLILLLAAAIFKYINSNKVAVAKVSEFESVKSELNGYKQRLRERETIMGRELQTERNKIEELNQMVASLKKKVH